MSDDEPDRSNFEEVARALADEVTRALERISEIDVDEIARAASTEAERARQWMDDLGRWLREQAGGIASADFVSPAWPDSAARAKDSLAQIAAGVKPESVKVGKSMLQKGASIVSSANGALESATGISAKDAALAATGVGASNLVAKKLGLDPMSIGAQALANAKMGAQQHAMQKVGAGVGQAGAPSMAGMAGTAMSAAQIQAMQRAAMANAATASTNHAAMANAMGANGAMAGYSQADIDALVAFQQEMILLSTAASGGDVSARARLEAWQTLALKYQPEAEKLSLAAGAGDVAAIQKLQRLQFDMIREWSRAGGANAARKIK